MTGHKQEGEKERAREMEERVRDSVWPKKGYGVGHKFSYWPNF